MKSEKLIGATQYLTLWTRCRINRCRFNRDLLYIGASMIWFISYQQSLQSQLYAKYQAAAVLFHVRKNHYNRCCSFLHDQLLHMTSGTCVNHGSCHLHLTNICARCLCYYRLRMLKIWCGRLMWHVIYTKLWKIDLTGHRQTQTAFQCLPLIWDRTLKLFTV
jgi:hypothetical protein